MAQLGVNIDHIATVRQARQTDEPDPAWAAMEAELGGADGITFHLREDRRHINDRDAEVLKKTVATKLNMEMSLDPGICKLALKLKPDQCTLVPERRAELTTEGGLDVRKLHKPLATLVKKLKKAGIETSAFVEPTEAQIVASAKAGFDAIEIWTGGYAEARTTEQREAALDRLADAIDTGHNEGLIVHAGHGLTYRNVAPVAQLPGWGEFNIGHSIIARATIVGMRTAVREMKRILFEASHQATDLLMLTPDQPGDG